MFLQGAFAANSIAWAVYTQDERLIWRPFVFVRIGVVDDILLSQSKSRNCAVNLSGKLDIYRNSVQAVFPNAIATASLVKLHLT